MNLLFSCNVCGFNLNTFTKGNAKTVFIHNAVLLEYTKNNMMLYNEGSDEVFHDVRKCTGINIKATGIIQWTQTAFFHIYKTGGQDTREWVSKGRDRKKPEYEC